MEMSLAVRQALIEHFNDFRMDLNDIDAQLWDKQWRDRQLFAVPSARCAGWPRFFLRRGRIPKDPKIRQGGVWRAVCFPSGKIELYMTCPLRECKKIIPISDLYFAYPAGVAFQNGSCVTCSGCYIHMWVVLERYHLSPRMARCE